ncbi:MAG: type II toxin-antitoxin system HicB family antitoxin [Trueperaceae bacterium]|nr:type II toxin-antitoxin system HicB family antitoxin [Trueperaceae bacterium]
MTYKTVLIRSDEGFAVSVPGLPGCWSQGSTEAEALANIQDAIRDYLAARDALTQGLEVREVEVPA